MVLSPYLGVGRFNGRNTTGALFTPQSHNIALTGLGFMRILIVENALHRPSLLREALSNLGYEVDWVGSYHEALELLITQPIQFVITEWALSCGDGLSLCRHIRALNLPHYVYSVLLTTFESTAALSEGFDAGANDFIRLPLQLNELHARVRAGERVLALEKTLSERNAKLSDLNNNLLIAHDRINSELKLAGKMLWGLLPPPTTKYLNISIDWLFCPSYLTSGDIFNFLRLDETRVGFYALDVAGHGVSAAMMSFSLFHLLTSEMQRGSPLKRSLPTAPYYQIVPPEAVMAELNKRFQTDSNNWLYFTMIYGIIDTHNHIVELSQAGHPNPVFLPLNGAAQFIGDGGFPIGLSEAAAYERITLRYNPGDHLVLYSDGITECQNMQGEMFGTERLLSCLEAHKSQPTQLITKALNTLIQEWHGNHPYDDDISMLILALQ